MAPQPDGVLMGRKIQWFHHKSLAAWGYKKTQTDTFAVLHPLDEEKYSSTKHILCMLYFIPLAMTCFRRWPASGKRAIIVFIMLLWGCTPYTWTAAK